MWIVNNIKMLYFDRTDVSEGVDIDKTSISKESDNCHYWYFLNKEFKLQPYVSNKSLISQDSNIGESSRKQ